MPSWLSASADSLGEAGDGLLRRFLEASRRAEIVSLVNSARSESEVARVVVQELGEALEVEVAFILAADTDGGTPFILAQAGLGADEAAAIADDHLCVEALDGSRAQVHHGLDLLNFGARRLVLSPWKADDGRRVLIGAARLYDEGFDSSEVALLEAVTESAGHALERAWLAAGSNQYAARQTALVRAAKALNASLLTADVLQALCKEISDALRADVVAVYVADENGGIRAVAGRGVPDEALGGGQPVDSLCASVIRTGSPQVLQPRRSDREVALGLLGVTGIRCAFAVPARRRAEVDGALLVGFAAERWIVDSDIELLAGFAELAGIAYRNADEHTAVRRAAMLDSLTGCLNHGAFHGRLREEIARAERTDRRLALISIDFDDFKSVNDRFGHLAGDALLRTLADVLRDAVRSYDQVGRLGGDEFMLLLPATQEGSARRVLDRALASLAEARLPDGGAVTVSAGVADWKPGEDANHLIERADRSLFEAKAVRQKRGKRAGREALPLASEVFDDADRDENLRRLVKAGTLGARLARLLDERAIVEAAIADLHVQLGYERCLIVRHHADGALEVLAAARPEPDMTQADDSLTDLTGDGLEPLGASYLAVAEGHPVLINAPERESPPVGELRIAAIRSELAVPVFVGSELWGAITLQSSMADAFETDDAQLLKRVADHVASALRTAELSRTLEQTYLGTAAALAATLEAKDLYTADHARLIADRAVELGRALQLDDGELRDLRYGALFHDIGKIAIPDAILNKPGALDEAEMSVIREHPLVGERILAPVAFLSGIRRIVRHDHERWDGAGYPDGLRGDEIPLGARIVFVVDAFHAMTSDRPYRKAMTRNRARQELRRHAGTQFDPHVVRALFVTLDAEDSALASA
jgi:diguanylate cyclase (GGDEF)-like protein